MKRFLMLDDDRMFHALFRLQFYKLFTDGKSHLTQIYTIEELINQISNEKFDVVFCDYTMMLGRSRLIDELERHRKDNMKLIMVTNLDLSFIDKAIIDRIDGYIYKGKLNEDLNKYFKGKGDKK